LAVALEGMSPITDAIASGWYRAEVLPVHLGRLLLA
jgi:CO/xanthine dehydrogenase FAD-binding subunit